MAVAVTQGAFGALFATAEKVNLIFFCGDGYGLPISTLMAAIAKRLLLTQATTAP